MYHSMNYFDVPALSYSKIKNFSIHPKYYKAQEEKANKSTKAMNNGSLFDLLLTEPDKADNVFISLPGPNETTQLGILYKLLKNYILDKRTADVVVLEELYNKVGFKQKSFIKIVEEIRPFQDGLNKELEAISEGRLIVTHEDYEKTTNVFNRFKNSEVYNKYLKDFDNKFQLQIFGKIYNTNFKCKPDIINEEVFDLKLTKPSEFLVGYERFRYFYQAAVYITMLNNEGHSFTSFNFITVDPEGIQPPLIYRIALNKCKEILAGDEHGYFKINNKEYKSVYRIVNEIEWHENNNMWDYEMDVFLNDYKIEI
jgi:hypothetical protein